MSGWLSVLQLAAEIIALFKGNKGLRSDLQNAKTSSDRLAVALRASSAE